MTFFCCLGIFAKIIFIIILGDIMDKKDYQKLVDKNTPKEKRLKNGIVAFFIGGFMGIIGQGLIDLYMNWFDISSKQASVFMIVTLIFAGCFLT